MCSREGDAKTSEDVLKRWDEIKATEKTRPKGLLAGIPRSLPALVEAEKISKKAAGAGFDWDSIAQVFDKMHEELGELEQARASGSQEAMEDELGDLLFVVVNIARFLRVDPEQALRKTNAKFRTRFEHVERGVEAQGKTLKEAGIEEMERLWQEAKRKPRASAPLPRPTVSPPHLFAGWGHGDPVVAAIHGGQASTCGRFRRWRSRACARP